MYVQYIAEMGQDRKGTRFICVKIRPSGALRESMQNAQQGYGIHPLFTPPPLSALLFCPNKFPHKSAQYLNCCLNADQTSNSSATVHCCNVFLLVTKCFLTLNLITIVLTIAIRSQLNFHALFVYLAQCHKQWLCPEALKNKQGLPFKFRILLQLLTYFKMPLSLVAQYAL